MDSVFVLGNGPSLRRLDLERLSGVSTIGMNAAYRYWERIDWYPTHYCCLDDELVVTHHDAIASLLREDLVRTALVTAKFLEYHPEFVDDERCHVFERFHRPSFDARGRQLGLVFVDHKAFRASEPWKVTTGAYAVRYAIYLGYRNLYLLGIDCHYVDVPLDVQPVGGVALELTRTPDVNPNYFFDDYQRAGDRFHVPNPPIYGDNLHLQSLEVVRDDIARLRLPIEIRVCSAESELVSRGVFPYEDVGSALRSAGVEAASAEGPSEDAAAPGTRPAWPDGAGERVGSWTPPPPSRYERLYLWAKLHNRIVFLAGRITMQLFRATRRVTRWR